MWRRLRLGELENRWPVAPDRRSDLNRLHDAHLGRRRAPAREGICARRSYSVYVPDFPRSKRRTVRQFMALAGVGKTRRLGSVFSEHCERRSTRGDRFFANDAAAVGAGTRIATRVRRSGDAASKGRETPFLALCAKCLQAPWPGPPMPTPQGLSQSGDAFSRDTGGSPLWPGPVLDSNSCYSGPSVFLSTRRPGASAMATTRTLLRPPPFDCSRAPRRLRGGDGLRLGCDLATVTLAGEQTPVVGHDASRWSEQSRVITFHERASSSPSSDTRTRKNGHRLKIAEALPPGSSPLRR